MSVSIDMPGRGQPGCLVLVVGPSGAGKDTLLAGVRARLSTGERIVLARRTITRPADPSEEHEPVTEDEFARRLAEGDFTLTWAAHGLHYAIPARELRALRGGTTVVCSVSRGIVAEVRERFPRVLVIEITAPAVVRAQRIAARGREGITERQSRMERRAPASADGSPDILIDNSGGPDKAISRLLTVLRLTLTLPALPE